MRPDGPLLGLWGSWRKLQTDLSQGAHAPEVLGGHGHHEELIDFLDATHRHLRNRTNELTPAEALLNELALCCEMA